MNQAFRRYKRDHYFLGPKGWRKCQQVRTGRSVRVSPFGWALSLVVVAIVAMRIIVDFL